jgi:hypothetical protein
MRTRAPASTARSFGGNGDVSKGATHVILFVNVQVEETK